MFSDKVAPENLNTKRLDSDFYRPEYIEIDNTLSNLNCVKLGTIGKFFTGPFGSLLPSNLYLNEGIPLFRVGNVGQFEALSENFAYLAPSVHEQLKVSEVLPGDLLLVKASVGEKICKVPEWLPKANITQHIIGIRPNQSKDTDYISAFLFCYYGVGQLQRYSLGSIIQYLGITDAKDVNLYSPDPLVQKYIGDKVRQAEQLRAWAKRLYRIPAFIDAFIQGALPLSLTDSLFSLMKNSNNDAIKELTKFLALNIEDAQMKQNFQDFIEKNKMGSVDIEREFSHINTVSTLAIEDFLSAQTYRPAITDAFDKITSKKFSTLQSISLEPIRQGATPKFSTIGKKCIKSKQTRDLFLDETGYEIVDPNDEQNKRIVRLKRNDILVTRQGAGTVGRASIFLDDEETYITDSLFLVRIDPAKANPAFVAGFLRSYTGQRLIEKGVYGSTGQLNLSSTALRNIPILDVPLEFQNFLGETLCTADTLFKLSTRLTQSAKTLVEALIEGQLTEQQLIQAQQALEDGDNSLDQAILSKLSAEGYAIEGATPLFSDVDELYSLLEEAAQAEAEE
ncbi:restriction endonuclease subunit S domain-containing protein [Citrobacter portucalensis]|uniref:restriction endonuclease subunit S n=1 Tax=Citrobacter portucalensis TaxID=1639133 RepID=UPI003754305B